MRTIFLGSNNKHKLDEIKDIFKRNNFDVEIKTPNDFNDVSEPIEDGLSFEDNAYIKAKYYFDKYGIPCIGEDSGICIEYFNNLPGIHSKRFLKPLNDFDKNEYILKLMSNVKNRNATFNAIICYIDANGVKHFFKGINKGEISFEQKGSEGFGYDPIFMIPEYNKTEAELGQEFKNINSHRAKAFNSLIEYLKNEK